MTQSSARPFRTLDDIEGLHGKRVLVREDLNVPVADGKVSDDTRLRATVPTVAELSDKGAIVLVLAHFGRPKGEPDPAMSLAPIAAAYEGVLGRPVRFIGWDDAPAAVAALQPGDIAVMENTRFSAAVGGASVVLTRSLSSMRLSVVYTWAGVTSQFSRPPAKAVKAARSS